MDLIQQGIDAFRSGRKEEANSIFIETIRQNPNSALAWFWLGKTVDDPVKKKACFDRVLQIDPDFRSKIQSGGAQNSNASSPQPAPAIKKGYTDPPKTGSPKKVLLFGCAGALLLIACLSLGLFTMDRIQHPQTSLDIVSAQSNFTETATEIFIPQIVSTQTPWPTFTHLPTVFETPQPDVARNTDATQADISLGLKISAVKMAYDSGQYDQCITTVSELLERMPEWSAGYYYRGMSKDRIALKTHTLDSYNQLLDEAREDLDKAIALGPVDSRYFTGRAQIYSHRQAVLENRTSEIEALNIGIDNLDAGARLGRYAGEDSEFYKPLFLSGVGRCQEAVDLAQKLISENPTSRQLKNYEYGFMAIGYLCLEDYAMAKQANEMPMQNNPDRDTLSLQARILIGLGEMDAAYSVIDRSISSNPNFGGDRYYLRALLHWDRGEKDLARQDLTKGSGSTWYHGGIFAYVAGLMFLDEGDQAKAAELFKYADATVKYEEGPWLRNRIREALAGMNIPQQEPTPNVLFAVTPIIFEQLTPEPGP